MMTSKTTKASVTTNNSKLYSVYKDYVATKKQLASPYNGKLTLISDSQMHIIELSFDRARKTGDIAGMKRVIEGSRDSIRRQYNKRPAVAEHIALSFCDRAIAALQ